MSDRRAELNAFRGAQIASAFGNGVVKFALPLVVFDLTGSPVSLGIASALAFLPSMAFGLVIGAWTDQVSRQRVMVSTDVLQALTVSTVPLAALLGVLNVWHIYGVVVVCATLALAHNACQFAAVAVLSKNDEQLVQLNGLIQASLAAAKVCGPAFGGLLLLGMQPAFLYLTTSLTFLVSGALLSRVRSLRGTSGAAQERPPRVRSRVATGMRYIIGNKLLLRISVLMAVVNFLMAPVLSQLIVMADQNFGVEGSGLWMFFSAASVGVIVFSSAAGRIRRRLGFDHVTMGSILLVGLLLMAFSVVSSMWVGILLWALSAGLAVLFNINTASLRQKVAPRDMLGFVSAAANVLAWSVAPLGMILGGFLVSWSGNAPLIYGAAGFLITITAAVCMPWVISASRAAEFSGMPEGKPSDNSVAAGRVPES